MKKEKTLLEDLLDIPIPQIPLKCMEFTYLTQGKLNRRGRWTLRGLAFLLVMIFFPLVQVEKTFMITFTLYIMSLPYLLNLFGKLIKKKMWGPHLNLYELLYYMGLYVVFLGIFSFGILVFPRLLW